MTQSSRTLCICLLAALVPGAGRGAMAEERPEQQVLVEQLRSNDYDTRRAAADKLAALGEAARAVLDQAAAGDDIEVRQTAATLLKKLDTASIRLMAFDRDGKPAAGAEADVRVYSASSGFVSGGGNEPRTDSIAIQADGTARLSGLAPKSATLQFTWKKWAPVTEMPAVMWRGGQMQFGMQFGVPGIAPTSLSTLLGRGENPLLLTLSRIGTVALGIQDAGGKPLKEARAQLYPGKSFRQDLLELQLACVEAWGRGSTAVNADEKGQAKVEGTEGVYQCVIRMDGYVPAVTNLLRLHEGESLEIPAVTLAKKNSGKLSVTLQNADGTPLKKTKVHSMAEYLYVGPASGELQREARRLRAQLAMQRSAEMVETDDAGQLTIEDLVPGKHNLTIAKPGAAPWQFRGAVVAAGQTTVVPPQKPAAVGGIKGKVIGPDGKGMQYASVSAAAELEDGADDGSGSFVDLSFIQRRFGMGSSQTQNDGAYEVGHLAAGKYTVTVNTPWGQPMLVYGVEVTAGKTTSAPDAAVPGAGIASTRRIKGTVLLPDGQPAEGATVTAIGGAERRQRNCSDKGLFDFSPQPYDLPLTFTRLVIRASGCRIAAVDLTVLGARTEDISVRLEKQEYGSLRIKVVDEGGEPLSDVEAWPFSSPYRWSSRAVRLDRNVSNRNGEVRLTGLAVGQRKLMLQRDGYYMPDAFRAVVTSDKEGEATAVMRTGFVLAGQVEMPEGHAPEQVLVSLRDRMTSVKAGGRFGFAGLSPGEYLVSAAAPGLTTAEPVKVVLSEGPAPALKLALIHAAGAAANLGAAFEGYRAELVPQGSWNAPPLPHQPSRRSSSGMVDAAGRVEFWGVPPGRYDVVVTPLRAQPLYYNYSYYAGGNQKVDAFLNAGTVEAKVLESTAGMRTLAATQLKVQPGSATARGRLSCEPAMGNTNANLGSVTLALTGRSARAVAAFGYPADFSPRRGQRKPIIIGTPPAGVGEMQEPGAFAMQGLPAGEYRLTAEFSRYGDISSGGAASQKPPPVQLGVYTIKEGEHANLGVLTFKVPPEALAPRNTPESWQQTDDEPEDRIPVFQP